MRTKAWRKVNEEVHVAFTFSCPEQGHMRGRTWDLKCKGVGYAHGHVEIATTEDGLLWMQFPFASQAGVKTRLDASSYLSPEERAAILALDEVQALPADMHPGEAAIFGDADRLHHFTRDCWASH